MIKEEATPGVLQKLRRWSVAGLAAALALAWTISTLVTPSSAQVGMDSIPGQNSNVSVGQAAGGSGGFPPGTVFEPAHHSGSGAPATGNGNLDATTPNDVLKDALSGSTLSVFQEMLAKGFLLEVNDRYGQTIATSKGGISSIGLTNRGKKIRGLCIDPTGGSPFATSKIRSTYTASNLQEFPHVYREDTPELMAQRGADAYKFAQLFGADIAAGNWDALWAKSGVDKLDTDFQNIMIAVYGTSLAAWSISGQGNIDESRVFWGNFQSPALQKLIPEASQVSVRVREFAHALLHQAQIAKIPVPGVVAGAAGSLTPSANVGAAGFDANGNFVVNYELGAGRPELVGRTATLNVEGLPQGGTLIDNATARLLSTGSEVTLPASVTLTLPKASAALYPRVKITARVKGVSSPVLTGMVRYPIDITGTAGKAVITVSGMPSGGRLVDAAGNEIFNGSAVDVPSRIYAEAPAASTGTLNVKLTPYGADSTSRAVVSVMEQSREVAPNGDMYIKVGINGYDQNGHATLSVAGLGNGVTLNQLNTGSGITGDQIGAPVGNGSKVKLPSTLLLKVPAGQAAGSVQISASTSAESAGGSIIGTVMKPSYDNPRYHSQWLLVISGGGNSSSSSSHANAGITVTWSARPVPEQPAIGTRLFAEVNGKPVAGTLKLDDVKGIDNIKLVDRVQLANLNPAKQYQLTGGLMDTSGAKIIGATFAAHNVTPAEIARGYADVAITIPKNALLSHKSIVAFEELNEVTSTGLKQVAKHEDPNDKGQTLTVVPETIVEEPAIQTQAKAVTASGESAGAPADKLLSVKDTVTYQNLKTDTQYKLVAQFKRLQDGKIVGQGESSIFQPYFANGTQDVTIRFNQQLAGGRYVVHEQLFEVVNGQVSNVPVAEHKDDNDTRQIVTIGKPKTVKLQLAKKLAGQYPNSDKVFRFQVTCDSGVNEVVSVPVARGQVESKPVAVSSAVGKLTEGSTCAITELNNSNEPAYTISTGFEAFNGANLIKSAQGNSIRYTVTQDTPETVLFKATNTYHSNLSGFQVKKVVKTNGAISVPNKFSFMYKCDDDFGWTYLFGPTGLPHLSPGETSRTVKKPAGTVCQVREVSADGGDVSATAYANNTITWSGGLNGAALADKQTYSFTVDKNSEVVLTAENSYTPKTGKIRIKKYVENNAPNVDLANRTFPIDWVCEANPGSRDLSGTVYLKGDQAEEIGNIPAGFSCYVQEQPVAINGATVQVAYGNWFDASVGGSTGNVIGAKSVKQTIAANRTVSIDVTNKITGKTVGGFTISKRITNASAAQAAGDQKFQFTYACTLPGQYAPTVNGSFSLGHGGYFSSATSADQKLRQLPVGSTCKVTETTSAEIPNFNFERVEYSRDWSATSSSTLTPVGKSVSFQIAEENTVLAINAANVYRQKVGALKLQKKVLGVAPSGLSKYRFQVACDGLAVKNYALGANQEATLSGVPVGTKCTVTELGGQAANGSVLPLSNEKAKHSIHWSGSDNDASSDRTNTVTIKAEAPAVATVVATNKYDKEPEYGKFSIVKQSVKVAGNRPLQVPNQFTFKYQCGTDPVQSVTVGVGAANGWVSPKIDASKTCWVTEVQQIPAGANGQQLAWSVIDENKQVVANGTGVGAADGQRIRVDIASDKNLTVVADNTYTVPEQPSIGTKLNADNSATAAAADGTKFTYTDTITYRNLKPGETYKFSGELMYVDAAGNAQGTGIKAEATTQVVTADGVFPLKFQVTAEQLRQYSKLVAFEKLFVQAGTEWKPVAEHEDPKDPNQSVVTKPWIKTVLTDTQRNKEIDTTGKSDNDLITMVDTVEYHNLVAGKTYHLVGKLVNQNVQNVTGLVSGASFTPAGPAGALVSGSATMEFQVKVADIRANQKLVAFEYLYPGETPTTPENPEEVPPTTEHEDPNDPNQSVKESPRIGTTAVFSTGEKEVPAGTAATVVDTVAWNKLVPGDYTLVGSLMDKATGAAVPGVKSTPVDFTVAGGQLAGTQRMEFAVPADQMKEDAQFVVFERVLVRGTQQVVAAHEDLGDVAQTVKVRPAPKAPRLLLKKVVAASELVVPANQDFSFTLLCGSQSFTKTVKANGTVELPYVENGDCTLVENTGAAMIQKVTPKVSFNTDSGLVALSPVTGGVRFHMPPKSEVAATITFTATNSYPTPDKPSVGTTLLTDQDGKELKITPDDAQRVFTLKDKVILTNLDQDTDYELVGWLTDQQGAPIGGIQSVSHKVNAAEIKQGFAWVNFQATGAVLLQNPSVTAFEELRVANRVVAEHKVPNEPGQTVKIIPGPPAPKPAIATRASVEGGSEGSSQASPDAPVKVKDTVSFTNLKVGQAYTLVAKLYQVGDATKPVTTGLVNFTAQVESGTQDVALAAFKSAADKRYVVYERLYEGTLSATQAESKDPIAKHEEATDVAQQITVTKEKPIPASFKIVKNVAGSGIPQGDKVYNFDITCMKAGSGTVSLLVPAGKTNAEVSVSQIGTKALESGDYCVVNESLSAAAGYTVKPTFSSTSSGVTVAAGAASATIKLDKSNAQNVQLNVKNTYTPAKGKFQIKKQVVTNGAVVNPPVEFGFEYQCGSGTWTDLGTLRANEISPQIVANVGEECQIREKAVSSSTVNNTLTWSGVDRQNAGVATVTVGKTGTALYTATNTLSPKTGQLRIVKRLVNSTSGSLQLPSTFDFSYVCQAGDQLVEGKRSVGANSEALVSGIPAGAQCVISENTDQAQVSGAKLSVSYTADSSLPQDPKNVAVGGTVVGNASGKVTVTAGAVVTVTADNTYRDDKTAGFEIVKVVAGTGNEKVKDVAFNFAYSCALPGSTAPSVGEFALRAGETFSSAQRLPSLPVGTKCEVWEKTAPKAEGVNFAGVSWFKNSLSDGAEVTMPAAGGTNPADQKVKFTLRGKTQMVKFTATNVYRNQLGGFGITKQATGKAPAGLKYNFAVTCGDLVRNITIPIGGSYYFWGIPVGTTCSIAETGAQDASGNPVSLDNGKVKHQGVKWTGTVNDASQALTNQFKVTNEQTRQQVLADKQPAAQVIADNTYGDKPKFGKFTLTKRNVEVADNQDGAIKLPTSFRFAYDCGNAGKGTMTVAQGETWTSDRLPMGSTCTISEVAALPTGTNGQNVTWTVDGVGAGVGAAQTTPVRVVIGEDTSVAVVADNQYTRPDKPSIKTQLSADKGVVLDPNGSGAYTLTDYVTYNNLIVGQTYQFSGRLMFVDGQGQAHETDIQPQQATVIAQHSSGVQEIKFVVTPAQLQKYNKLVAFEKLNWLINGQVKPVADHEDPKDENQAKTPKPVIRTVLETNDQRKQIDTSGKPDSDLITMVDTVTYQNLVAGHKYHLVGTLVNESGNRVIDYVAGTTFVPQGVAGTLVSGKTTVSFQVPVKVVRANAKLVAFEYLYPGETPNVPENPEEVPPTTEHEDPNDPNQSVKESPRIATTATSESGTKELVAGIDAKVVDRVEWSKLEPGRYLLVGTLMDKATNQPVAGAKAQPVEFSVAAGELAGVQQMVFTVPGDQLNGNAQYVVFEQVYSLADVSNRVPNPGATPKASHQDINDAAQTVKITKPVKPTIGTTATDKVGAVTKAGKTKTDKQVYAGKEAVVKDVVQWSNLPAGNYTLVGKLVTGAGEDVTLNATAYDFTVKSGETSGRVEMLLKAPANRIVEGVKYVAFERVYKRGDVVNGTPVDGAKPVAVHEDITDAAQTVTGVEEPPASPAKVSLIKQVEGGIDATGHVFKFRLVCLDEKNQPINKPDWNDIQIRQGQAPYEFEGLGTGYKCTLSEDIASTAIGEKQTKDIQFASSDPTKMALTKQADNYSVSFTVPSQENASEIIITAVNKYQPDSPSIGTKATNAKDGSKNVVEGEDTTVKDTVSYKNLDPAKKYRLRGVLNKVNASGTEAVSDFVCGTSFQPAAANGATELLIPVAGDKIVSGGHYVVFEYLYEAGQVNDKCEPKMGETPKASHEDPKDENQIVVGQPKPQGPKIWTAASDQADGDQVIEGGKPATIVDRVSHQNLPKLKAGQTLRFTATLVDKKSLQPIAVQSVPTVLGAAEVAKLGKAPVLVNLKLSAETTQALSGNKIVVFETLELVEADGGAKVIAVHEDPQDAKQTVTVNPPPVPDKPGVPPTPQIPGGYGPRTFLAKTGLEGGILIAFAMLIGVAGVGLVLTRHYQKKEK